MSVLFSSMKSFSQLCRATYCVGNRVSCLEIPTETYWPTDQFNVTQSQYWELYLVTKGDHLGFCLSHSFGNFIYIMFICINFRRFLLYLVSILLFKCPIILLYRFYQYFPSTPSSQPVSLLPPILAPHPLIIIYSITFS